MTVTVKYTDKDGVKVSMAMEGIVKIEPEDGKIVATHESGARLVTEGTTLIVESSEVAE